MFKLIEELFAALAADNKAYEAYHSFKGCKCTSMKWVDVKAALHWARIESRRLQVLVAYGFRQKRLKVKRGSAEWYRLGELSNHYYYMG